MPNQNIQSLLVPQWVQSYPLAEDYGAHNDLLGENIGDLTGLACIVNDIGVWVATAANLVLYGPATGVILRSERTGLRYGETDSRTEKGTATSVMHLGYLPEARAGSAISRGDAMTVDDTGKWIPVPDRPTVSDAATAAQVRTALQALLNSFGQSQRVAMSVTAIESASAENDYLSLILI